MPFAGFQGANDFGASVLGLDAQKRLRYNNLQLPESHGDRKMKKIMGLGLLIGYTWMLLGAPLHEHALYEPVSLDGTWEMAYQPYAWETVDCPSNETGS